jgi:hypothetical protein
MNEDDVIKKAWWLSLAGLLPFLWLSVERWADAPLLQDILHQPPIILFLHYAAIILSFLGGITWGFALHLRGNSHIAGWIICCSIIPALIGWIALATIDNDTPTHLTWLLLISGFVAQLKLESLLHQLHFMPSWFWHLRCRISAGVLITLLLNWVTA